jgi:1-pyrroline-5-carboxylate dehydrogenase
VQELEYVAWTADQDAYAYSGQKCSAQSIMFAHENWVKAGIEGRLKVRAVTMRLRSRLG